MRRPLLPVRRRRRALLVGIALLAAVGLLPMAGASALESSDTDSDATAAATVSLTECPWMDTGKTAAQRARLLLKASSLEQKMRWLVEQSANQPDTTEFGDVIYPEQQPCTPDVTYTDGPDVVRGSDGVTAFPAQIGLAASWDTDLAYEKGQAQGVEAFEKGKNVVLGPGVASGRTPLSGRTPEYLGEDSLLGGNLAAAQTNGLQSGTDDTSTMAVLKHYVANEQETDRSSSSSNVDERTLHEVYDLPFEVALDGSSPGGVMCSYNQINGVYSCENPLLNENLREELGFDGYVVSDFGAVHSTADSLAAGLDQELNSPKYFSPENLEAAVEDGEITEKQITTAAFRVVKAYIEAGLFDTPVPTDVDDDVSTTEHQQIAEQIVTEGSVLLQNDDEVLPLTDSVTSIAVIGPTASSEETDGISAASVCGMTGYGAGDCEDPVAPLDAITERAEEAGATVTFDDGSDLESAAQVAADADVAVVFGYTSMGEGTDLTDLNLDGDGDDLIAAVAAANSNTVAVLETGSAVVMPWQDDVKGILEVWYPGEQQGLAVAELLWGDENPSGKLPMTFPASVDDLPTSTQEQYPGTVDDDDIRQVEYTEGLAVGYKWYQSQDIDPLYAFGYGLSYTTYSYSDLSVTTTKKGLKVSYAVTNTGDRAGKETGQVYVTLPKSSGEPGKRLAAYQQVNLKAGQTKKVTVTIETDAASHPFSIWNVKKDAWTVPSGKFVVEAGGSSDDLDLKQVVRF